MARVKELAVPWALIRRGDKKQFLLLMRQALLILVHSCNQFCNCGSLSSAKNAQPATHFPSGEGMAYLTWAVTVDSRPFKQMMSSVPRRNFSTDSSLTPPHETSQA
jgi:hypothetical protein